MWVYVYRSAIILPRIVSLMYISHVTHARDSPLDVTTVHHISQLGRLSHLYVFIRVNSI